MREVKINLSLRGCTITFTKTGLRIEGGEIFRRNKQLKTGIVHITNCLFAVEISSKKHLYEQVCEHFGVHLSLK